MFSSKTNFKLCTKTQIGNGKVFEVNICIVHFNEIFHLDRSII